jgi:hypothetical protein
VTEFPSMDSFTFRDENSQRKLCYPLRRFRVHWCEQNEAITFLNLEMRPLVRYCTAPAPVDAELPAPVGSDETSWRLLSQHVAHYRKTARSQSSSLAEGLPNPAGIDPTTWIQFKTYLAAGGAVKTRPEPVTVAIPQRGAPSITPWNDLKPDENNGLLWSGTGIVDDDDSEQNDALRWRDMLPAFAAIEQVNMTPFFFFGAITSIASSRVRHPRRIGRGTGLHAFGIPVKPADAYRLRVDQVTPHAFCADAPTTAPFRLTIGGSDTGVRPSVKDVQIDGPYGHYELSFDVDPSRAGTYVLHVCRAKD